MSDFLWCPECRQAFIDEERIFFVQRCTECGGLLERDETGRCEVDYKELDIGFEEDEEDREGEPEEEEGQEDEDPKEDLEEQDVSDDTGAESEAE
ncbi:hypothetical protein [Bradyrhizobium sp. CCBAU 65884]|uniref:hypothetical protein n=1 Tax=Bradyrhizobium sp. CCBAU 65884 TaxID=722477 RepID=UPI002305221B|nr:hypothetical protein [Bradyrhizobium sp. CCBAU 65884]